MNLWVYITALGDSAVLLPCAGLMLVSLFLSPATRSIAWQWGGLFLFVAALVAASKLIFMAWGLGIPRLDFIGISGHSAMAALVWPSMLSLMAAGQSRQLRKFAVAFALLLALLIAVSRLMLHAHSTAEVVTGSMLGSATALWFISRLGDRWMLQEHAMLLPASVLLILPFVYGHRFPSEQLLRFMAQNLSLDDTVYTRRYFRDHHE
jgi:membrane-associated phospholipid phosphatase